MHSELYEQPFYNQLLKVANKLLSTPESAEDAVQDVFAKLVERPDLLNGIDNPKGYVKKAVYNHSVNVRKAEARREEKWPAVEFAAGLEENFSYPNEVTVDQEAEQKEQVQLAVDALQHLSDLQLQAFTLKEIEGYTTKEVAQKLSISYEAAKERIKAARGKIRHLNSEKIEYFIKMQSDRIH